MKSLAPPMLCALFFLVFSPASKAQAVPAPSSQFLITPEKLSDYVGQFQYDDDPDLILSVSVDGSRLFVESYRSPHQELVAQAEDDFYLSKIPVHITFKFTRAAEGKVIGYDRVAPDGSSRHAKKISDQALHFEKPEYVRQEAMIPMRDSVKLHAVILRPKDFATPLPFLMERTPYGVDGKTPESINSGDPELAASRYIFVFEDIRGRFKSEGTFVMSRAMVDHR
jgi:uncharacterized protein